MAFRALSIVVLSLALLAEAVDVGAPPASEGHHDDPFSRQGITDLSNDMEKNHEQLQDNSKKLFAHHSALSYRLRKYKATLTETTQKYMAMMDQLKESLGHQKQTLEKNDEVREKAISTVTQKIDDSKKSDGTQGGE